MMTLYAGVFYLISGERTIWPDFFQAYLFVNGISRFDGEENPEIVALCMDLTVHAALEHMAMPPVRIF